MTAYSPSLTRTDSSQAQVTYRPVFYAVLFVYAAAAFVPDLPVAPQIRQFLPLLVPVLMLFAPLRESVFGLLVLSVMPSDFAGALGILVTLGRLVLTASITSSVSHLSTRSPLLTSFLVIFLVYTLTNTLICYVSFEANPTQTLMWFISFPVPFIVLAIGPSEKSRPPVWDTLVFLSVIVGIQIITALFHRVSFAGLSPDYITGISGNAHILAWWLGVFILPAAILLFDNKLPWRVRMALVISLPLGIFIVESASAKSLMFSFAIGAIITLLLTYRRLVIPAFVAAAVLGGVFISNLATIDVEPEVYAEYVYQSYAQRSVKDEMYERLFEPSEWRSLWIGAGPGMAGSRAAIAAAGDLIPDVQGRRRFHVATDPPKALQELIGGLVLTPHVLRIWGHSAVLYWPISSLAAAIGELGIIGTLLLGALITAIAWHYIQMARSSTGVQHAAAVGTAVGLIGTTGIATIISVWDRPALMLPIIVLSLLVPAGVRPSDEIDA